MTNTLLLEIGVEEFPIKYIEPVLNEISEKLSMYLLKNSINYGIIRTFSTPRRLAVLVYDVALKQSNLVKYYHGPSEKIAFDSEKKYTKAAIKFIERIKVLPKSVKILDTNKGRYLCAKKVIHGEKTKLILEKILPKLILSLTFPKSMRWSNSKLSFGRPIRTLVALLGSEVINFNLIDLIKSDNKTTGHLIMSPGKVDILNADIYVSLMKKVNIIVDFNERRELILRKSNLAAEDIGGKILYNKELLFSITNIVESPTVFVGKFDSSFLNIPKEILITVMEKIQKYFVVVDKKENLLPYFIGVSNTFSKNMSLIVRGHEKVLNARLKDAIFFYNSDLGESMDLWFEKLKEVFLISKLGNVYDKVPRIEKISLYIAKLNKIKQISNIKKSCFLCKGDLVSRVVTEFPNLQGVMGAIYSKLNKESDVVCNAVREHYLPTHFDGLLPKSQLGKILSIADKIDSICGCFLIGLSPTSDSDQYALKRQTFGLLRIMLETNINVSVRKLINKTLSFLKNIEKQKKLKQIEENLHKFFKDRFFYLMLNNNHSSDTINCALNVHWSDVFLANRIIIELEKLKKIKKFPLLIIVFKRVDKILFKSSKKFYFTSNINKKLFEDRSEIELDKICNNVQCKIDQCINDNNITKSLKYLFNLVRPVNNFFDKVLVMVDNEEVKKNRLSLLKKTWEIFRILGDFSYISVQ